MGWGSKKTEKDLSISDCVDRKCNGCEELRQAELKTSDGVTSLRNLTGQIPSTGELNPPASQHRICARPIDDPNRPIPLGFAAFQESGPKIIEVMYYVQSTEQGQGIGTILAREAISRAKNLGYKKAHFDISPGDTASIHVVKKLGARKVGGTTFSGADLQGWEIDL